MRHDDKPGFARAGALVPALLVIGAFAAAWASSAMADPPAGCTLSSGQYTCVFAYTGGPQTWTVPGGATTATFYVYGAAGGAGAVRGGGGGVTTGTAAVTPGAVMQVNVGGKGADASAGGSGGWNGGGAGFNPSGGGGGASDVRGGACAASQTCAVGNRLIVAGGGGGGAGFDIVGAPYYGGDGGGPFATAGYPETTPFNGGAGTDSAGGAGGDNTCGGTDYGIDGDAGQGGNGGQDCPYNGAGGGGGYFGGGGGGATNLEGFAGFSGGGGSSRVDPSMTYAAGTFRGARLGNGLLIITTPLKAPTVTMSYDKSSVDVGETFTLTYTITNPNLLMPLDFVHFFDDLPTGFVSVSAGQEQGCDGATINDAAGTNAVSVSYQTMGPGATCVIAFAMSGSVAGTYTNTSQPLTYFQGPDVNGASASIQVGPNLPTLAPIAAISFSKAAAEIGESVTLTATITNPNPAAALTGVHFFNYYPGVMLAVSPAGNTAACNGGVLDSEPGYIFLSAATIPAGGTCTFSATVAAPLAGNYVDTSEAVGAAVIGSGNTATASIRVGPTVPTLAPIAAISFSKAAAEIGESVTLTATITNPNPAAALTGVHFFNYYPGSMRAVSPVGNTAACNGGVLDSEAEYIFLSAATIPAGGTCTFSATVAAPLAGNYVDTSEAVGAAVIGSGNTATASITVGTQSPTAAMRFSQSAVTVGDPVTLNFSISNPNGVSTLSVYLFNYYPSGLKGVSPSGTGCNGGTLDSESDYSHLSGGTLAPGVTCTYAVTLNTLQTGTFVDTAQPVGAFNLPTGGNAASASVVVLEVGDRIFAGTFETSP